MGARRGAGRQQSHPGARHEGTTRAERCPSSTAPLVLLLAHSLTAAEGTAPLTKAPRWQDVSFIPATGETGTFAPTAFILPRGDGSVGGAQRLPLAKGMRRAAFSSRAFIRIQGEAPRRGKAGVQHLPSGLTEEGGEKQQPAPAPPPRTPCCPNLRLAATQGCCTPCGASWWPPPHLNTIPIISQAWHARG